MIQLDSLRALAVLGIVVFHWVPATAQDGVISVWASFSHGFLFLLSGYFLTRIVLKNSGLSLAAAKWGFYRIYLVRRALRLVPLYYLIILLAALIGVESVRSSWLWHVTFLSNFFMVYTQGWFNETSHFWFLAVIVQFSIIWPLLLLFVSERNHLSLILITIVTSLAAKYFVPQIFPELGMVNVLPLMHCDALGFGSLLAYYQYRQAHATVQAVSRWACISFFLYLFLMILIESCDWSDYTLLKVTYELGLFGSLWLIVRAGEGFSGFIGRVLNNNVLLYLGKISYGLFLLHLFSGLFLSLVRSVVDIPVPQYGVVPFLLRTFFTVGLAMLSYHYFEAPINRFRKQFVFHPLNHTNTGDK